MLLLLLLSASLRLSLGFYVAPLLSLFVAHDRSTIATVIFFSTYVQSNVMQRLFRGHLH